ncbi:hypothetical protein RHMOL_Rhmol03G0081400 [Rhododendron molle]|uniref:Uncharacterized protein n=1 Tax=Rhododendron molle TaxID=49168 RepID=A0ACC0PD13_RHOML|nr:hypothetical protein RHMOL_Rhmol03G0081400 [Rhododendron molle]
MPFALFTWKTCMWGCAPKAIIIDQCMAMKNAIEDIFPNARHRWCIWHIMKKITEKLNGYNAYESISWCMCRAVYASLIVYVSSVPFVSLKDLIGCWSCNDFSLCRWFGEFCLKLTS